MTTTIDLFRNATDFATFTSGQVVFNAGDPGDVMFAVVEGRIELTRGGTVIEDVGPGGIIGELALIDSAPRSASATARASARVASVDHKYFTYLGQEHPTFALQVMTVMAARLRKANEHA